jgi:4-amino-4-deoxy-L-arabinose transferase-like glycosyltransferase
MSNITTNIPLGNDTNVQSPVIDAPPPVRLRNEAPVIWMILALAAVFAWRIFFTHSVNLIPDECSYWAWSRRLDWSYFDNSGMVAYLIRLSTSIFNESTPFTVRLPFLVLSGLTTFFVYRIGALLFESRSKGLLSAVVLNLTPVALLGGSAAIHDNALLFFWVLALWAAARFLIAGNGKWFYVMGASVGLAIQCKYTGVLAIPILFIFFLWNRQYRAWLWRKEPWLGAAIAVAFTLPIIWWNFRHDWASFYHILFIGSGSESLLKRVTDGLGYHLSQFLLISPLIYLALLVGSGSSLMKNIFKPDPREALLLCFGLPVVLFGVQAFRGHVEANWAFMGYASVVILAIHTISESLAQGGSGIWRWFNGRFMKWAVILSVAPVLALIIHAWLGLLPASLETRIAKDDRVIWETRGWEGLGRHVGGLLKPGDIIAADSYQLCALLEFNVPGQPQVRYLAPWKRPTQFDVWEPSFDNLKGRDVIFVSPSPLLPSSNAHTTIYENFAQIEELPPYEVKYHGTGIRKIYVYRGLSFDASQPRRLGPRSLLYREY